MGERKRVFIIAGEASGDLHASHLVRAIQARQPGIEFEGLGGPKMAAAGVHLLQNIVENLSIIGLTGIIQHLPELHSLFQLVNKHLDAHRPDAVLLVDYPGFNLRVAKQAKKRQLPVIYYICPQTWAWHESRARDFPLLLDKMLTIFPFEEELFRRYGADATFVGHPLLELLRVTMGREEVCAQLGLDPRRPIISLLPGSREREVRTLLPVMLEAASRLHQRMTDVQFVLPKAETISRETIDEIAAPFDVPFVVAEDNRTNVRAASDFAWVASGTATLETALLGVPMVILYKASWLNWAIGKRLVKLPYIGLANIVAEKMIVPELLQDEATAKNLARATREILGDEKKLAAMKADLAAVRAKMEAAHGESHAHGAYDCAAVEFLKNAGAVIHGNPAGIEFE